MSLVVSPPMSRRNVLRVMVLGFGVALLLVAAAGLVVFQGSKSIQQNAQNLVREHLLDSERAANLESQIERQSGELMRGLPWILGTLFVLALSGAALTILTTDRAFRKLEWQADELQRVSWHLVENHEKVARRFSHEMHDELGQALAGLKGIVLHMSQDELPARREELIAHLDEVMTSVRELSQLLRPVILDDLGLDAGLKWLVERFTQRTQISVEYRSNCNARMSDLIETQFFRIAQEALTNIARHSGASAAWVCLQSVEGRVRLEIEDNGRGLPSGERALRPTLGMVGMRARARRAGGELIVDRGAHGGLRILVDTPFAGPLDYGE